MSAAQRVVFYRRVSGSGQEDNYSLPAQLKAMESYARDHHLIRVADLVEVHTGAELEERPRLQEAMRLIQDQRADILLAHVKDRLSRDPQHFEVIRYYIERWGGKLEFVLNDNTVDSPFHDTIDYLMMTASKIERGAIARRTMTGRRERAEVDGLPSFGRFVPYGYMWQEKTLVKDPETREIVEHIFQRLLEGISLSHLAQQLNREGVPSPKQYTYQRYYGRVVVAKWNVSTLSKMIRNPIYTGVHIAFRWRTKKISVIDPLTGGLKSRRITMDVTSRDYQGESAQPVTITCPAYVDPEDITRIKQLNQEHITQATRNNKRPEQYWLRGVAYCGYCGRRMIATRTGRTKRPNGGYYPSKALYRCGGYGSLDVSGERLCPGRNSISADALDAYIWYEITEVVSDPAFPARYFANTQAEQPLSNLADHYAKKIKEADAELATLAEAIGRSGMNQRNVDVLLKQMDVVQLRRAEYEEKHAEQLDLARQRREQQKRQHMLDDWINRVKAVTPEIDYANIQAILYGLGVRVVVWKRDHLPHIECTLRRLEDDFVYYRFAPKEPLDMRTPLWSEQVDRLVRQREALSRGEVANPESKQLQGSKRKGVNDGVIAFPTRSCSKSNYAESLPPFPFQPTNTKTGTAH